MKKYIIIIIVVISFLVSQFLLKSCIYSQPEYREIITSNPFSTLPPIDYLGTYIASVAIGGFKPLLVDYLWIKQDRLQRDKQFEEIRLLLSIIARLQPKFVEVWSFNAYNMIYNISSQEKTAEAKWYWVKSGIDYIKEGMKHNQQNPALTQWLAFFYYHRIPQEIYFMRQVESTEGIDTYEVAAKWYQETIQLYKEKKSFQLATSYEYLYSGCRFLHSFELIGKNRFDDAIKELEYIMISTPDKPEVDRIKDLIEVLKYDKEIAHWVTLWVSQIQTRLTAVGQVGTPDFINKNSSLLEQYNNLINNHIGFDFNPINARIEVVLNRYIKNCYYLIDHKQYNEANEQIKLLLAETTKITPKLDLHPSRWYFLNILERFEKLRDLVNAECYLKAQNINDQRWEEIKSLYEQYIRKYSSRWLLGDEKERFNNLMGK
ncbi:MAG: hypothetical protein V1709_07775 [Planctomycetota bacterium]